MSKKIISSILLATFLLTSCTKTDESGNSKLKLSATENKITFKSYKEEELSASAFETIKSEVKGYENINPEQITGFYTLGDLSFAFVSQPNSWTPLLEVREWEKEGNTAWSGILIKEPENPWKIFFVIPEEDFNPLALHLRDQDLALDIVDDSGAGSGEGQLIRYVYPFDGVTEENLYKWTKEACDGYYVPETYMEESCV